MGCELTKLADSERTSKPKEVRNRLSNAADNPTAAAASANNTVDPRLPLNARQKYSMLASWKGISRALEPTGVYMFIKLFEQNSHLLDLFEKFKALETRDAQAESQELAEHATSVMNSLDEGIKSLDNLDNFYAFLHQVAQTHHKIPGFRSEYFWKIKDPFLESVKTTLGDRYTDNIEAIYKTTIHFVIETLVDAFEKSSSNEATARNGEKS